MTNPHYQAEIPPDKTPRSFSRPYAPDPSEIRKIIGDGVRAARLAAHMTQADLAGQTYTKSYISALERGKMVPSLQTLRTLAERMSVSVSSLLGERKSHDDALEHEQQAQGMRVSEAKALIQVGRYEEALALFEQIGRKDCLRWAHEQYSQFLAEEGRYQEAYEQMRLAL